MTLNRSSCHTISVAIMVLKGEHCAFVIESYIKNGEYHCHVVTSYGWLTHRIYSFMVTSFGDI